jgi:CRISPR/Cas system-associated exonuclease Cas4 (RecB family)
MSDLIANQNFHSLSNAFDTEGMAELLEKASKSGGRQSKFTKKKSFAPSGIGYGSGTCPRYWYYAFNGADFDYDDTTARQRANMDSGTAAGERIAKLFKDAGILKAAEVEVKHDDPPIYGFMDLAVTWQDEEMIGEVKTTKQETFNYRQSTMKAPGYQLIQLLIYMRVFNKEKGFFVIENKNTHELLILPVKMTEANAALVDRVFEWMRIVKKNADEGELPKRPFTKASIPCNGCPVRKTCWEGYKRGSVNGKDPNPGTIDLPALEIPK